MEEECAQRPDLIGYLWSFDVIFDSRRALRVSSSGVLQIRSGECAT